MLFTGFPAEILQFSTIQDKSAFKPSQVWSFQYDLLQFCSLLMHSYVGRLNTEIDVVVVSIPYCHLQKFVLQNLKPASVHDIMDYPWPCDADSRKAFEKALTESFKLERIKPMHVLKVGTCDGAAYANLRLLLWYNTCDESPPTCSTYTHHNSSGFCDRCHLVLSKKYVAQNCEWFWVEWHLLKDLKCA